MLPFKANYGQDPRMGFKGQKKGKYEKVEKFTEKIKEIQEEVKAVLEKAQEKMKKYADKKRAEVNNYRVGDLVMFSTKDCHKLHSVISPPILRRFPRSQNQLKALKKTFR